MSTMLQNTEKSVGKEEAKKDFTEGDVKAGF